MEFTSTRDDALRVGIEQALNSGLAPDGGLYVPTRLPDFDPAGFEPGLGLPECALQALAPYFDGSSLAARLDAICREAFDIPLPVTRLDDAGPAWMLELFHGPTAAFKDFAARFLAGCLAALHDRAGPDRTVLVATSGDTGAAVAAAFHDRPGFRVVVLYPDRRVSARQAHQLGAFGGNVHTYRVQGDFDDCQRLVKQALADRRLAARLGLTSANSISIGRLLPQTAYYAQASLRLVPGATGGGPIDVIVPTGNLGNALACIVARESGFAIGEIWLATNANRTLPEYFESGRYRGRAGIRTLANAMDVGDPSNFERLEWLYRVLKSGDDPRASRIGAESIDDETIRATIRDEFERHDRIVCPHTACAMALLGRLRKRGHDRPVLVAATAHPAKFETVIEPVVGRTIEPPEALAELLGRPSRADSLEPDYDALVRALDGLANNPANR
ncbi:MAG: threonine synthase [Wenzhouxiangellaceae bacterium]|nr:threonine synthase [Wenzhouxiangellaceae bacterium]